MGTVLSLHAKSKPLTVDCCHRLSGIPTALSFNFSRCPTDAEKQFLENVLKRAVHVAGSTEENENA